jgi:hypothetical protein
MPARQELPVPTALVLAVFAKELADKGFSEARIDTLLVKALEHELRQDGLTVVSLDGE